MLYGGVARPRNITLQCCRHGAGHRFSHAQSNRFALLDVRVANPQWRWMLFRSRVAVDGPNPHPARNTGQVDPIRVHTNQAVANHKLLQLIQRHKRVDSEQRLSLSHHAAEPSVAPPLLGIRSRVKSGGKRSPPQKKTACEQGKFQPNRQGLRSLVLQPARLQDRLLAAANRNGARLECVGKHSLEVDGQ